MNEQTHRRLREAQFVLAQDRLGRRKPRLHPLYDFLHATLRGFGWGLVVALAALIFVALAWVLQGWRLA